MSRFYVLLSGAAGVAAGALFTLPASAQCVTDADCGEGLICNTATYETPCDAPPEECPEGQSCDIPECEPTTVTRSYCENPPCQVDADCGEGMICRIETYEVGCGFKCEDDGVCEADPECVPTTESYSYCEEKPCESDADCGTGRICIERTWESCTGGAAVDCDEAGNCTQTSFNEECTTESSAYCGYRYEAECTVSEDCGPGFDCVPNEVCWCGGSTGGVSGEGGAASVPEEPMTDPECGCEPTGTNRCELQELACTTDADCPADFLCIQNPSGWCTGDENGTVTCGTDGPAMVCYPSGWYSGGLDGGGTSEDGTTGSNTGTATGTTTGTATGGVPPRDDDGKDDDTSEDGSGASTGTSTGSVSPGDDDDDNAEGWPTWGRPKHGSPWTRCSVTSAGMTSSGGTAFLTLLGLAMLGRRRRS
jgi:MYXO-CTERM domain-containing protein